MAKQFTPTPEGGSLSENAPRPRSKGEKIFDDAVYTGLGGVATFILTIPVAHKFIFGSWKGVIDKGTKWLTDTKPMQILPTGLRHKLSKSLVTSSILMQGGNLMLLPIAWAEHYKVRIVRGLNTMLGDETDPALIEEAPKQSLGNLFVARMKALGVVFASFFTAELLFEKPLERFNHACGRALSGFTGRATHINLKPGMIHNGVEITEKTRAMSKTYEYGLLGGLDIFATAAATTLLYEGSRDSAKKHAKKEGHDEKPTTSVSQVSADTHRLADAPEKAAAV